MTVRLSEVRRRQAKKVRGWRNGGAYRTECSHDVLTHTHLYQYTRQCGCVLFDHLGALPVQWWWSVRSQEAGRKGHGAHQSMVANAVQIFTNLLTPNPIASARPVTDVAISCPSRMSMDHESIFACSAHKANSGQFREEPRTAYLMNRFHRANLPAPVSWDRG